MHSQQPPCVVQNWSTLQCSKHNTEQCGYDHAPVTRGCMRTQFPLPHGLRRGVGVRPPLQPPKLLNSPRGHTLAGGGPRGLVRWFALRAPRTNGAAGTFLGRS